MTTEHQKRVIPREEGLASLEREFSVATRPGLKFVKPDAREESELSETLARLEVNDMLAPFRALAMNIREKATLARNNEAAMIAHLRETADQNERKSENEYADACATADGIVRAAENMQSSQSRCRAALALAHEAATGASVD